MKATAALFLALLVPLAAVAETDVAKGQKLVAANKCEACHGSKVPGPTGSIYLRGDRIVTSWAKLKAQVAACNNAFSIGLFPEDEEHIAAFLNATYYKLPAK
jgi:cytochrome c2